MSDFPRHVSGHASASKSRLEHGQLSDDSWPPSLGISDGSSHEDLMDTLLSSAGPASLSDLNLDVFCDNLKTGGSTNWKDLGSFTNIPIAHVCQYQAQSGKEPRLNQLVDPEEFDIPQARTTSPLKTSTGDQEGLQISNRSNLLIQSVTSKYGPTAENTPEDSSRVKPLPLLPQGNSAQSHEALQKLYSIAPKTRLAKATEKASSMKEVFTSMESSETLDSPQKSSVNDKATTSSSSSANPSSGIANSTRLAESHTEGETSLIEQSYASNRQTLLPSLCSNPTLPAGKVFPIQIGSELFKLSGASISSDAPSYFSQFFSEQLLVDDGRAGSIRTLYIDRDPATFRDILLHLQGYHVKVRDTAHFVRLFADAQFYSLPRLIRQLLYSEIHINIGDTQFQVPRELFSAPGDSPNYFTLGFGAFFSSLNDTFPGLDKQGLLRPPSIHPPSLPNRSAEVFKELLHYLKGYPIEVRSEAHRATLLKEARYFHFKGLEQRLLPHEISFNASRQDYDIFLRLEDIRQSGISFAPDTSNSNQIDNPSSPSKRNVEVPISISNIPSAGTVRYSRPYVDEDSYGLVFETSDETTILDLEEMRVAFSGQTKARVASLLQVMVNKMNLPATQPLGLMLMTTGNGLAAQPSNPSLSGLSDECIRVRFDSSTHAELDGKTLDMATLRFLISPSSSPSHLRSNLNSYVDENISGNKNSAFQPSIIQNQRPPKRRKLDSVGVIHSGKNMRKGDYLHDSEDTTTNSGVNNADNVINDNAIFAAAAATKNTTYSASTINNDQTAALFAEKGKTWMISRAQWRVRVELTTSRHDSSASAATAATLGDGNDAGMEVTFYASRLDALSGERARNARRGFLT